MVVLNIKQKKASPLTHLLVAIIFAFLAIIVDQGTKIWARSALPKVVAIDYHGMKAGLYCGLKVYTENTITRGAEYVNTFLCLCGMLFILLNMRKVPSGYIMCALYIGAMISNYVELYLTGTVTDFIGTYDRIISTFGFGIANVADIVLVVSFLNFIVFQLVTKMGFKINSKVYYSIGLSLSAILCWYIASPL